jgi:hypothetical protein
MAASDAQLQAFADGTVRPTCEQVRNAILVLQAAIAQIEDVYNACAAQNPTWADTRTDIHPPHLMTPSDVLAWNAFAHDLITAATGNAQWPIILKCCVQLPR